MLYRTNGKAAGVLVAVAALALSGTVAGVSAASAAAPAPGNYNLVNNGSGLCLTGTGSSAGVQLTQNGCGGAGQAWTVTGSGTQLKAVHSGLCAGVKDASTSAGKAVQQENCTG
ncbi:RICIN domain-containing protein, partial [Streptosporangium sp. LJ11]|uniref:RICIN domain-containing protein n=1 Tax=Streptosporangium sp. LJ11 TaxID=3436927 RepID=UPI003F7A684C